MSYNNIETFINSMMKTTQDLITNRIFNRISMFNNSKKIVI